MDEPTGARLRDVLIALGDPLVAPLTVPAGLDVEVRDVVILDPDDDVDVGPGDFVLVIGARGRAAAPVVRAAGRKGAVAVAVKGAERGESLRQAAEDVGTALLTVRTGVRWQHLEALIRSVVGSRPAGDSGEENDLFALAQTVAALTGGIVSIEDTANRVLAYSRSSAEDEVDELRRLSILGRQGPEPYLALLREWGVYQRLRASEDVVRIDARADLGIRRRLAVGIHAGDRRLGAIWVQEAGRPLEERADTALLGAARVAALHLIRQRNESGGSLRLRENLLAGLLEGRMEAASVAGQIGANAAKPAVVVAFAVHQDDADRAGLELRRAELTGLLSVHAAAYRRSALVTSLGARTYALLPDLPAQKWEHLVHGLVREVVSAAKSHIGARVQAAVGSAAPRLGDVSTSRQEADWVMDSMSAETDIATLDDVRSAVLVQRTLALLTEAPKLRDPGVAALISDEPLLAASLRAYLDAFGDVKQAAAVLNVHPNTLRYRLRRAVEVGGLDLDDPEQRLFAALQLRL